MKKQVQTIIQLSILMLITFQTIFIAGSRAESSNIPNIENQKIIYIIPHTHFDPFWLDPWVDEVERWSANVRNALDIMQIDEDMTFVLDQVVGIKYFYENYPQYRTLLKDYVQAGRIEIVQGFISQPELNLGGELGYIQDAAYGIKWSRDVLGANITTGWELDVFGFGAGTPTFYNNLGLKNLVMCRTGESLNDGVFNWTALDGSKIYGYKMPHYTHSFGNNGLITGTDWTNVNEFFNALYIWIDYEMSPFQHTINPLNLSDDRGDMMVLYGSDFSNPNLDLSAWVDAWNSNEAEKTGYYCKIGTPREFFERLDDRIERGGIVTMSVGPEKDLNPVFSGYYTSRVNFKESIRYFENHLLQAETFASIAKQLNLSFNYPEEDFERIWYKNSVSHHHDSLTGTSRQRVYDDNMRLFEQERPVIQQIEKDIFATFMNSINFTYQNQTTYPLVSFNPLSWDRSEIIRWEFNMSNMFGSNFEDLEVIDPIEDKIIPSQIIPSALNPKNTGSILLFKADIPSIGYKTYLLRPLSINQTETPKFLQTISNGSMFAFENQYYNVNFNASGNNFLQIYDKVHNWNVFSEKRDPWQLIEWKDVGDTYYYGFQEILSNSSTFIPDVHLYDYSPVGIQLILSYTVGSNEYRRNVWLYDEVPKIEFYEDMDFYPENNTSTAIRWAFNFPENGTGRPDREYDIPFSSIIHNKNDTFYPALYYVNSVNSTHGVSLMNYGIHGYRTVDDQLEGVLIRYLVDNGQRPLITEGSQVVDLFDNGSFTFRYAIETFDPSNNTEVIRQKQHAYNWNLGIHTITGQILSEKSQNFTLGVMPMENSFYSTNSSDILAYGLKKNWLENSFTLHFVNLASDTKNFTINSKFSYDSVQNCDFTYAAKNNLEPTINFPNLNTLTGYSWNSVLLENKSWDINGPKISKISIRNAFIDGIKITIDVNDQENSSIQNVFLQYNFVERFADGGNTWIMLEMKHLSGSKYEITIPTADLSERPIYIRILAIDEYNNEGFSLYNEMLDNPAISTSELIIGSLLFLLIMAFILFLYKKTLSTKLTNVINKKSKFEKILNIFGFNSKNLTENSYSKSFIAFSISILLGLWIYIRLIIKGYFGIPIRRELNPGNSFPDWGAFFNWELNQQNNIYDFYGIDFFLTTFIISFTLLIIMQTLIWKSEKEIHLGNFNRILWIALGIICIPLIGILLLPLVFLVSNVPISYYSQIGNVIVTLYTEDSIRLLVWFLIPVILADFVVSVLFSFIDRMISIKKSKTNQNQLDKKEVES